MTSRLRSGVMVCKTSIVDFRSIDVNPLGPVMEKLLTILLSSSLGGQDLAQ